MPDPVRSSAFRRSSVRSSAFRRSALTWLRYRAWTLIVHVVLIAFGVANLYPFIWMLGTSFKAEEEASTQRQTPLPQVKYRLAAPGGAAAGLNARQTSMLQSLRDENARRAESRAAFPEDRWTADAYARKFHVEPSVAQAEIDELVGRGLLVAGRLQSENYWIVLKNENFILHFLTTLVVTIAVVVLTVLSSSMLGYALARLRFPGKMLVLALMLAGAVAPREAVIIPIFRLLKSLGALNGIWGMVLWLTGVGIGNAFLMAGFFLTLPKEVEEAAAVDGAGPFRTFFDVALPMARPIVTTVGLFAFLNAWNNFLIPLLCTVSRPSMQPLAVAVYNFQRGHPGKWQEINAAAAIMIVPAIALFLILQRHIVKGVAVGAIKG